MKVDIDFRGMEHTQAIHDYIAKNIEKFKKYLGKEDPDATFVHVRLDGKLNHNIYNVEIRLKSPHFDLIAQRENHDMYPLIDEVVHIMERELKNAKEKFLDGIQKADKPNKGF